MAGHSNGNNGTRRRRKVAKAFISDIKAKSSCQICGSKEVDKLTFHHVRGTKRMDISTAAGKGRSVEWLKVELAKCDILCEECHRRVHNYVNMEMKRLKRKKKRNGN